MKKILPLTVSVVLSSMFFYNLIGSVYSFLGISTSPVPVVVVLVFGVVSLSRVISFTWGVVRFILAIVIIYLLIQTYGTVFI